MMHTMMNPKAARMMMIEVNSIRSANKMILTNIRKFN